MANITNGTVTVQVSGGVGPYQFTLLNAGNNLPVPSNAYPTFTNPVNNVNSDIFTFGNANDVTGNSGLQPGSYRVKIVDANLCETMSNVLVVSETVPNPTATPVPTAEPTATPVPAPTATEVPDPTATEVPDPTATPVPDPTATEVPDPTATPVPDPTATEVPDPTATPEPTATEVPDPTATEVPDPTATPEPTATATPAPQHFNWVVSTDPAAINRINPVLEDQSTAPTCWTNSNEQYWYYPLEAGQTYYWHVEPTLTTSRIQLQMQSGQPAYSYQQAQDNFQGYSGGTPCNNNAGPGNGFNVTQKWLEDVNGNYGPAGNEAANAAPYFVTDHNDTISNYYKFTVPANAEDTSEFAYIGLSGSYSWNGSGGVYYDTEFPFDNDEFSPVGFLVNFRILGAPTATPVPPTATPEPTATEVPPTATPVPPTATPVPEPTATEVPPTATPEPTATEVPPTATPVPPTATPVPEPTATEVPDPTATPVPEPTATEVPDPTATPVPEPTSNLNNLAKIHFGIGGYPYAQDLINGTLYKSDNSVAESFSDLITDVVANPEAYDYDPSSTVDSWEEGVTNFDIPPSAEANFFWLIIPDSAGVPDLTQNAKISIDGAPDDVASEKLAFTYEGEGYVLYKLNTVPTTAGINISYN